MYSAVFGFVSAGVIAFASAYWGSKYAISEQRALHSEHAAAVREVIRFEAAQNLRTLKKSTMNLRRFEAAVEAFLAGDGPAPPMGPGYIGLATAGLRLQVESPNTYYTPHGLVGVYGLIYGRLTDHEGVWRDLQAAVVGYAAALTLEEKRRGAANVLIRIKHLLKVSEALVAQEGGLPVLLLCLDQFSAGAGVCEYTLMDTSSETDGNSQPAR